MISIQISYTPYSALLIFSFEATMWKFAGETHKIDHNLPEIEDLDDDHSGETKSVISPENNNRSKGST